MARMFFVDCEAHGPCPSLGRLTWFGAVEFTSRRSFNGLILHSRSGERVEMSDEQYIARATPVFLAFRDWLREFDNGRLIMWSDNPAFDWQWINDGFWRTIGHNPFGHSARRIGDFYAGLVQDPRAASRWKRLRITPHDHNPVNDATGNVEAFERMLRGERVP